MLLVPATVLSGLARLRARDLKGSLVFGASSHRYALNAPLSEHEVTAFETKHGIALPAEYRDFLLRVGNGGAGPYYGFFRLGESDEGHDETAWEVGSFVGSPSKPFRHTAAWNLTAEELEEIQEIDDDGEAMAQRYWMPVEGAIPLCHRGCALRDWLVVTGPEAGHVWHDATADYEGWKPVLDAAGARATFGRWYEDWLGGALAKLEAS